MTKKPKNTPKSYYKLIIVVAALGVGGFGVGTRAAANLAVHHMMFAPGRDVTLAAPATPTRTPAAKTPTPKPTSTPIAKKAPAHRVAYVPPKPLPPVTPAPNSVVSHLVPVVQPPTPSPTSTPAPGLGAGGPTPSPTPPPAPVTAYYSSNWAGYMAPAGNFTAISGSWTVPNAGSNGFSTSADAAWIGIGGVTTSDLIQVGTDNTVSRTGQVSTIAFYEMLPDSETPIPSLAVTPGDVMSADIHLVSGSQWLITINDVTQHETFSITVTYSSTESTAEWIEEDPSFSSGGLVPFDRFGSVNFTDSLATSGGVTQNLISSGAQEIILVNTHGHALATPSAGGSDGGSFTVTGG